MNREDFMCRLAEIIRPRSVQAGTTLLLKMLPSLTDLEDDLFTDQALAFIAPKLPRSPSIGLLRAALGRWRLTLSGTPLGYTSPLGDDDPERWVPYWQKCSIEGFPVSPGNSLHLIRSRSPAAFNYLIENDLKAADIAVRNKWERIRLFHEYAPDPTPEEAAQVREIVAQLHGRLRSRPLYVDPDPSHIPLDAPMSRPPIKPRHLTPEQLDKLNPLPNGRKRTDAYAAKLDETSAAPLDPDPDAEDRDVAAIDDAAA